MAWARIMGADSVSYHRDTVVDRADDFPGQTLAYYGSRGETPMHWGGAAAARLGLTGPVTHEDYSAIFGPGGACDPVLGGRLVSAKRPGLELVVSAHKSVAVLGVIGQADDMHRILDAETDATIEFLDTWVQGQGGRRGRLQVRTPTSGLVYGRTRHATSRAGDPNPHDHVLVANMVEMLDERGGWKGLDTAGVRDLVHAATAVGRLHAAWEARRLGYPITPDHGPSGKLDHFAIAGIPAEVCQTFSKRSDQIDELVGTDGSYRLRGRIARNHRPTKADRSPEALMDRWHAELAALGHTPASITTSIERHQRLRQPAERLTEGELRDLVGWTLSDDGPLSADKQFGRADLIRHLAPQLHGRHPAELTRAVGAVLAHPEVLPLIGRPGARNRAWALASTIAIEHAIADCADRLAGSTTAASVDSDTANRSIAGTQRAIGARLTTGQRELIYHAATSGRRLELVLGVAGAGKTTALDALRDAFETAGHRVLGTAVSGQAARTLGTAAHLHSRTCASLLWRLRHGREHLDAHTVLIVDEAGMVDDRTMLRLLTTAEIHGSKVIVVGDHLQLGAVGPGGGLEGLITRHPEAVYVLDENIRQHDPAERDALEQLRCGNPAVAVSWYAEHDRIAHHRDRWSALLATTAAWQADIVDGHEAVMLAWRRADVAALNQFARQRERHRGAVGDESIDAGGGRSYAVGDRVVALAPDPQGRYVTSQRGNVTAIDQRAQSVTVRFDGANTPVTLTDQAIDAEHLDHGYATTVHRAQGATVDRTHVYADGGGRELAYVACSRARDTTTIHCVADNPAQAIDDLIRDWGNERRPRWTIDTDHPAAPGQRLRPARRPKIEAGLRLGRIRAERNAVLAALPADPTPDLTRLDIERHRLQADLHHLQTGTGPHEDTDIGHAARALARARRDLDQATREARSTALSRRQRNKAEVLVDERRARSDEAAQRWSTTGQSAEHELLDAIDHLDGTMASLEEGRLASQTWSTDHPAAIQRLAALDEQIEALEIHADVRHQPPPSTALGR
jgi:conjugative relaxase-like TrwC/TraI family protein